jgi:hypothetical protein
MKFLVTITLAVLAAASGVTAQDTLLLRTYRTVDVCSSERRWLIAPYLGNIRSADSLASFDITIGFDTTNVRPTDVLSENTLSSGIYFPATMTLVVPGEMRVFGFNVTSNMVGDKPICAVAGNFVGSCTDSINFTFPWPPTFNEEFKKKVTVLRSEQVQVVATPKRDNLLGVKFDLDTLKIDGRDSVQSVQSQISFGAASPRTAIIRWTILDSTNVAIDSISVNDVVSSEITIGSMSASATVQFASNRNPTVELRVRNTTSQTYAMAKIVSSMQVLDTCACVTSGLADTLNVSLTNPIVSISSPVDDSNERLLVTNTTATCHCNHGQTNEIAVFTVTGERIASQRSLTGDVHTMSLEHLPPGPYIIVGSCGSKTFVNLNLK